MSIDGIGAGTTPEMEEPVSRTRLAAAFARTREALLRTDKTRSLFEGTAGSLALRLTGFGLRFLAAVVLARLLGVSNYGWYAYAISWLAFLVIPTTLGLDQVLLRFIPAYRETGAWPQLKGVLRFAVWRATAVSIAVAAVAVGIAYSLPGIGPSERAVLAVALALLPIAVLAQIRQSSLRAFDHPVLAQVPENLLYPVVLIALACAVASSLGGLTALGAMLANVGAWILAFVLGTVFALKKLPAVLRGAASGSEAAEWTAMMPPLVLIGLAFHLISRADVLVLGLVGTPRDVGLYTAASRGGESLLLAYDAVTLAGASLFSALYARGDLCELQRFTSLACRIVLWSTLPIYVALMVAAPRFLGLFGAEFVAGAGVMRVLLTTYLLSSLSGFVIVMLYTVGRQRDVAVTMCLLAPLALVLHFVLIPRFGPMGAAFGSGVSLLVVKGTLVVVLFRRVGVLSLPYWAPAAGAGAGGGRSAANAGGSGSWFGPGAKGG